MRISDWSSYGCSSGLLAFVQRELALRQRDHAAEPLLDVAGAQDLHRPGLAPDLWPASPSDRARGGEEAGSAGASSPPLYSEGRCCWKDRVSKFKHRL